LLVVLALTEIAPQTLFVILLLSGELRGFVRQVADFRTRLLVANPFESLARLSELLGGALGFGLRLPLCLLPWPCDLACCEPG